MPLAHPLQMSRMSQSRTVAMAGANKRMQASQVTYDAARFEAALLECCRVSPWYTLMRMSRLSAITPCPPHGLDTSPCRYFAADPAAAHGNDCVGHRCCTLIPQASQCRASQIPSPRVPVRCHLKDFGAIERPRKQKPLRSLWRGELTNNRLLRLDGQPARNQE